MSSISLTPTKSTKVCCVCGENKKEVRSIESEKGKERKLSQLLLKYGDLNLVQGIFTAYQKRLFPGFVTKNSSTNQKRAKNQNDNNWKHQTSRDQYKRSDLYSEDLYYTTAVTTLMKFQYPRKQIMGAVEHYVCMKGNTDFNAEDILRMLQERQISKDSIEVDCPTSEKSTVKDSEVDTIREENKKIVDSKLCKICLVKNVNVVFLPCGHICACSDCSPYIKNCAICRTFIKNVVNIKVL